MHPLLASLCGGDRRSIGDSNRAAALAADQPALLAVLFQGLDSDDPILRMRCSDAIEKATSGHPEMLIPFKHALLTRHARIEQKEVRWHVAPLLVRLPLTAGEASDVMQLLLVFVRDRSSIVRTITMQALADLAHRFPELAPETTRCIREFSALGTPAMKARARKLLRTL